MNPAGIYQQIAAAHAAQAAEGCPPGLPFNPSAFLLNAHLAMAASQHQSNVLNSAYAASGLQGHGLTGLSGLLRQNRFSPYSTTPPGSGVGSSAAGSAFKSIPPKGQSESDRILSPTGSPSESGSPEKAREVKNEEKDEKLPSGSSSESKRTSNIANMEQLVNGLNGGSGASTFGISHSGTGGEEIST